MLGRAWRQLFERLGVAYQAPSSQDCDLRRPNTLRRCIHRGVRLVVNCAAYTNVDAAEQDEETATLINGVGVGALAQECAKAGCQLVHYSTDYVFDGGANRPYEVGSTCCPVNAYGRSKLHGERFIEQSGCDHLIVRTSWLYAAWGANFVLTIAKLAAERPTLRVVNDQFGRPTSVEQLVAASWKLIETNASGIFHVTDDDMATWYDLATEVVKLTDASCEVQPCTTADFPRLARRPAYSVLDLTRTIKRIGPLIPWRESLRATLHTAEPIAL